MPQPAFTATAPQPWPPTDPVQAEQHRARATYHYTVGMLHRSLPPPPADDPAMLACRNAAALGAIKALAPADDAELMLAEHYASACIQARACGVEAYLPTTDLPTRAQCLAQQNAMRREARSALKALTQLREFRAREQLRQPDSTSWAAYIAGKYLDEALARVAPDATPESVRLDPVPSAAPEPVAETVPETVPPAATLPPPPRVPSARAVPDTASAPAEAPAPEPDLQPGESQPTLSAEAIAALVAEAAATFLPDDVKEYAIRYPERVALIRRVGGVPDNVSFGPPDQWIVDVIVSTKAPMILNIERNAAKWTG